ncbi:MAG: nucleoside triphosphate pyrophosphohydrolase [Lentisphaerae bacterium]|nr:nucleoside triphosphate pyrophosphohydrolase [Lentisphaerota bacterium]
MPMDELLKIMALLRGKGGCPWDREQTLESLKQYLVEECYEVVDALDSGEPEKHKEELGDLLLQVVFQSQIRKEQGRFTFQDVVRSIRDKLIRRHPHVFERVRVSDSAEVLRNWDRIKGDEKRAKSKDGKTRPEPRSAVEGIPRCLPALHRAHQIQKRVARVGFDWDAAEDVVAKVAEELKEVRGALAAGDEAHTREEIGDLLFAVVNLARKKGWNAEEVLDGTIAKFVRRFQAVERRIHAEGRQLSDCSLKEMDRHWNGVKREERKEKRR